ncbi:MAG: sulfotransferase [Gemmatimonadota bacterium]|nr:MAG: sulfotransferase [Gemmatimonadota bacterium]
MMTSPLPCCPTFVVIGAMRCGTTSFHAFLSGHPDIYMSPIKGPALFVDPAEPIRYPSKYVSLVQKRRNLSDAELIAEMTRRYAGERHFGEATDLYTRFPAISSGVPSKMFRTNPDMKLMYLVRHPGDRILSQFRFEQLKPLNRPPVELADYLNSSCDVVSTSLYHQQLSRFLNSGFHPDAIHLIVLEELLSDPIEGWKSVCRFLRIPVVEPSPFPRLNCVSVHRSSLGGSESLPAPILSRLQRDVERLEAFIGRRIGAWHERRV